METQEQSLGGTSAKKTGSFDFSKSEATIQNIIIPNSQFGAKWVKDDGYAIGIENVKITKNYKTLEEALNQIGYGVDKDNEGDEVLVKVGNIDYELIVRIVKALLIIDDVNTKEEVIETIKQLTNG